MIPTQQVLFGTRAIIEAVEAGQTLESVWVGYGIDNPLIRELKQACRIHAVPIKEVSRDKFTPYKNRNHQGALGFISPISYFDYRTIIDDAYAAGRDPLLIILDRITDVRNFGAICRTADIAGVDAVIIPFKGGAQIHEDAIKTSAGALHYLPICREYNLKDTLADLSDRGIRIVACSEKAASYHTQEHLTGPLALIMGSEGEGISPEYIKRSHLQVSIPQFGHIESLNVSVATGVILFEILRQRGYPAVKK